jgi:hypothetical protein
MTSPEEGVERNASAEMGGPDHHQESSVDQMVHLQHRLRQLAGRGLPVQHSRSACAADYAALLDGTCALHIARPQTTGHLRTR